eukprot:5899031-Amphidinium_carterae.1
MACPHSSKPAHKLAFLSMKAPSTGRQVLQTRRFCCEDRLMYVLMLPIGSKSNTDKWPPPNMTKY